MNAIHSLPTTKLPSPPINSPGLLNPLIEQIAQAAPDTDREGAFPEKAFQWLAEAGLLAITLPEHDLDFAKGQTARLLQLLKRIGYANLAVGRVYEGHINALYLIHLFATPDQRTRWYTDVTQHQRLFSVWNTQADNGVRIDPDLHQNGVYHLSGMKTFCSGAGWIQRPLVTGDLQTTDQQGNPRKGWQMAIVPTEQVSPIAEDAQFWQPLGMRASASFKLDFTGVDLTDADLLGKPGDYFRQPSFSGGAIRFAAVQLGGPKRFMRLPANF
ncbi:acyl-CoA dehydrogenase family protein [Spirosoma telluris]|uniref:acyl-CoA dehydrogenase family protein n=1 Tax=Spirosoma telluris TaxID=2183553 RepID=UPI002FC30C62